MLLRYFVLLAGVIDRLFFGVIDRFLRDARESEGLLPTLLRFCLGLKDLSFSGDFGLFCRLKLLLRDLRDLSSLSDL